MQPKRQISSPQLDMFRNRLESILNHRHELYRLSGLIKWEVFESVFGNLYSEEGRPGIPICLLVGLTYLSHAFNTSDEETVRRWVENPYHQYFCGEEYFRHALPIDPSSLSRWRKRIGEQGSELVLKLTVQAGLASGAESGWSSWQRHGAFVFGRVYRDIVRMIEDQQALRSAFLPELALAERLLTQQRQDKNKLHSLHAPEVECISKGKAHKKYEFGVKMSVVTTNRDNFVVGMLAEPGNPYDGHTLAKAIDQVQRTGCPVERSFVDRGHEGGWQAWTQLPAGCVGRQDQCPALWRRATCSGAMKKGFFKDD